MTRPPATPVEELGFGRAGVLSTGAPCACRGTLLGVDSVHSPRACAGEPVNVVEAALLVLAGVARRTAA